MQYFESQSDLFDFPMKSSQSAQLASGSSYKMNSIFALPPVDSSPYFHKRSHAQMLAVQGCQPGPRQPSPPKTGEIQVISYD